MWFNMTDLVNTMSDSPLKLQLEDREGDWFRIMNDLNWTSRPSQQDNCSRLRAHLHRQYAGRPTMN